MCTNFTVQTTAMSLELASLQAGNEACLECTNNGSKTTCMTLAISESLFPHLPPLGATPVLIAQQVTEAVCHNNW